MNREKFDIAAVIAERMDKLEQTIFGLQEIMNKKSFSISGIGDLSSPLDSFVKLDAGDIATEVFIQDILEYYIGILNLELNELRKSFEEI